MLQLKGNGAISPSLHPLGCGAKSQVADELVLALATEGLSASICCAYRLSACEAVMSVAETATKSVLLRAMRLVLERCRLESGFVQHQVQR